MHCHSCGMRVTQPKVLSILLSKRTAKLTVRTVHDLRSGVSTVKYLWQDGTWQNARPDQVPLLKRISAAEDVVELIQTLVPVAASSYNNNEQLPSTHVLDSKVMSVYLSRLAEYKLSDPDAFDARAVEDSYSHVLNYIQKQLILACNLQSDLNQDVDQDMSTTHDSTTSITQAMGLPAGNNTYAEIQPGDMSNILWALAVVGGGDKDTCNDNQHSTEHPRNPPSTMSNNSNSNTTTNHEIRKYGINKDGDVNYHEGKQLHYNNGAKLVIALGRWASQHLQQGCQGLCDAKTQDLTSLLWAHACLFKQAGVSHVRQVSAAGNNHDQGTNASSAYDDQLLQQAMCSMLDGLCCEMATRLREVVSGSEMQPQDLADVSWSLSVTRHRSAASIQLIEAVAHEVYRQISNRHSLNEPFRTPDLIKILKAYASLDKSARRDAAIPRMLDAIAGCVVKRVQRRDVNAISRPADIAQLLHAYADLEHTSVVIPEMISCTANQLRQELATLHVLSVADNQQDTTDSYISFDTALGLLEGYRRLNFYPGTAVVTALLVSLTQAMMQGLHVSGRPTYQPIPGSKAVQLLQVLSTFRHHPGPSFVDAIVTQLHKQWQQGCGSGLHLLDGVLAAALLGFSIDEQVAEDTCQAVLYLQPLEDGDKGETYDENTTDQQQEHHQHQHSNNTLSTTRADGTTSSYGDEYNDLVRLKPLPATSACELLFALIVSNRMTIRRFGMACMAVREDPKALNNLQAIHLLALAGGALLLGEEGYEMMEEVLPQELIGMSGAALSEYMHSWANSLRVHPDGNRLGQDVASAAVFDLAGWHATEVNEEIQVLGCTWPLPLYKFHGSVDKQSESELAQAANSLVSFDIVQPAENAVNSPASLSGIAIFRKRLLEAACFASSLQALSCSSLTPSNMTQSHAEGENLSAPRVTIVQISMLYLRELEHAAAKEYVTQLLQHELHRCVANET